MIQTIELASLTVLVQYRDAQQAVKHQLVPFKVYEQHDRYIAIPLLREEELIPMGIPERIAFRMGSKDIIAIDGASETLMKTIREIVRELNLQRLLG